MKWIFVVGCYNSGTTLLEQMLRRHPFIAGLPDEGQFLTTALVTPRSVGVPRLWAEKEHLFRFAPLEKVKEAQQIKQDWLRLLDKPEAPFAVEKSPTNTARTLWLQAHFAEAYFINIVRNGYTVAIGIHDKVTAKFGTRPNLLSKAANQWARSLEVIQADAPYLQHFLEVRYEDLTAVPMQVTQTIFDFLGLPPLSAEQLLEKYTIHNLHSVIENQNASRLNSMCAEQKAIIEARAREFLVYYSYLAGNL